jgi:GntR family transcriptional regulator
MQIYIDYSGHTPICQQAVDQIKLLCVSGRLRPGQKLPSVRQLATDLHINPTTVTRIYDQLAHEGVITLRQGQGTFVADGPPPLASQEVQRIVGARARALLVEGLRHGLSFKQIRAALEREHQQMTGDEE